MTETIVLGDDDDNDDDGLSAVIEPVELGSRSRSVSNSTLLVRSQSNSQNHFDKLSKSNKPSKPTQVGQPSQNQLNQTLVHIPQMPLAQPQTVFSYRKPGGQKAEEVALTELLILARRYYLTQLFNLVIDESIQTVFPGIRSSHAQYKKTVSKVRQYYKNWKTAMLDVATKFLIRWIDTAKADHSMKLLTLHTHKTLRRELLIGFNIK